MKRIIRLGLPLFAVAILSVTFLASCGTAVDHKIYRNEKNFQLTMEFMGDSTVIIKAPRPAGPGAPETIRTYVGIYRVTGNLLIVTYKDGGTSIYRILDMGKTLIEEDSGDRWAKL